MANDRPAIPEPIKREVRQRCSFGCAICKLPIYEYEHIEEWAIVQRHVADEITLASQSWMTPALQILPNRWTR